MAYLLALAPAAPPPDEDYIAHFNTYKDDVLTAYSLQSQDLIDVVQGANDRWVFDDTEKAARCEFSNSNGQIACPLGADQIWMPFSRYAGEGEGDSYLSWQWECKHSAGFADDLGSLLTHKAIRLDDVEKRSGVAGEPRQIEFQMRYSLTDDTAVMMPTIRTYVFNNTPSANQDPLRGQDTSPFNFQPGGDCGDASTHRPYGASNHLAAPDNTFLGLPDVWWRATITYNISTEQLTLTMSDENNDPVVVVEYHCSKQLAYKVVANRLRLEFATSIDNPTLMDGTNYVYIRFVLIDINPIPHGTRPVAA